MRYLIVTSEALAGEFQRLADHRTAQGLPALVVTTEWITANYRQGADLQETIRFFLREAYSRWGMEFLLIGGDTPIVPTRTIRSYFFPYDGHTDIPTDLYYAALDGTWAGDGDGWYGEPYITIADPGDGTDMAPEVAFGRAPVRDAATAAQFVDKLLRYEGTTADADWPNRVLYAAEVLLPGNWEPGEPFSLDGAEFSNRLIDECVTPCSSMEYLRMHETDIMWPRDVPLTRASLIDSLNTGHYGQVNQFGHGHFFNMSVGDANFTVSDASALTNPNPFLLFALNCASGAFDMSCLLERFVQNPDGGAIMTVGAAREAFPSNSFAYQSHSYDLMLCQGESRPAVAFNAARLQYVSNTIRNTLDRWTQLNAVIQGDPALSVWSGSPIAPQITAPSSVVAGEQTITITVAGNGGPVAGADVCLVKADETYAWGVTDAAGQAQLTVIPATAGALTLTVSGRNLEHTTRSIGVQPVESFIQLADVFVDGSPANGNELLESGENAWLMLSFTDVGGGGATGLSATFISGDSQLNVLSASIDLPDCPPGGTIAATEPVIVNADASTRDGVGFPYRVEVTDGSGGVWISTGSIRCHHPQPEVVRLEIDDATYGDNDGEMEDGERVVLRPVIKNFGSGYVDQLVVQIVDPAPGVTVHGSYGVVLSVPPLTESESMVGELSVTLDMVAMTAPCRLTFLDNHGRTFDHLLQFRVVTPPAAPVGDATVAPDAISLRWEPVAEPDIVGYNIYRAEAEAGPYVKVNTDLIEGLAYYQDKGLEQLKFYWHKVTAVDAHFMESDFSAVSGTTTMPAEIENFPLPFGVQTSGHAAVGDIDGDGRPEIVLASDEIYAWNDDGTELVDGDNDAQTTGPLTGVSGEFGPSGVALANLDGEPGLEIIAAERSVANRIVVYKADGTLLPGWPRTMQSSWNWACPSVGDVDGDGDLEVVVNDLGGRLFVWHHDGTELVDGDNNPATDGIFIDRPDEWPLSSPALFDLDGDGACEIIYGTRVWTNDNMLMAYRYDGTQAAGFPYDTGYDGIICSPAIADLNWDGRREVIFFTTGNDLHVVQSTGTSYPGFPIHHEAPFDDSAGPSPGVGNFDADQDLEVLWPVNAGSARMDILVVDTDVSGGTSGDILPGWPVQLPANSEGSPVVGDLDGDGMADVVVPIGSDPTETPDLLMAFDAGGQTLAGFPIALGGHCRSTPVICDLDLDGDTDLVYGSWDLELHVWDMPAVWDPHVVPWPTFQGNAQRSGRALQLSYTAVDNELPESFTVMPPRPNPFNPVTTVRLYVAPGPDQRLDLSVFDVRGRMVRRLHQGSAQVGWHEFTWDGRDDSGRGQSSGVYFVQARQAQAAKTFKMTLVK